MNLQRQALALFVVLLFSLTSCQSMRDTSTSPLATLASPLQQPDDGKGTIVGQVTSRITGGPIANVAVRLAEVYRQGNEGVFVLDDAFSPGDLTDEHGRFIIENVEAKEYVIVVGDVNVAYEIITEPSGMARVWNIAANQVFDVGNLRVNLEP